MAHDTSTPHDASKVQRFTTEFILNEDRIRILVERKSGDVLALWLTRRLLNRLIALLFKRLSTTVPQNTKTKRKLKEIQKFIQISAANSIRKQPSVRQSSNEARQIQSSHLITAIEIKVSGRFTTLHFKAPGEEKQQLQFSEATLRQWLSILHKQYLIAQWIEPFWPTWLGTEQHRNQATSRLN